MDRKDPLGQLDRWDHLDHFPPLAQLDLKDRWGLSDQLVPKGQTVRMDQLGQ